MLSFDSLKSDYERLWATMTIRPERLERVDRIARKLITHKDRYQVVEHDTGVPWFVVAALHNRESDADFATYLGNGEPLNRVTRLVPAGRGPFDYWEDGAADAIELDGLDKVKEWTPARACYEIEKFNGFGYRSHHPEVKSPYLWSFTNHYDQGKYVADSRFEFDAIDQQCGAIPIMRRIMEIERVSFGAAAKLPTAPSPGAGKGWLASIIAALAAIFRRKP